MFGWVQVQKREGGLVGSPVVMCCFNSQVGIDFSRDTVRSLDLTAGSQLPEAP